VTKLRVGILFGGRSTEHEVSVLSATTVLKALDPERYTAVLIGIDHAGRWHLAEPAQSLLPEAVFSRGHALEVVPSLHGGLELRAADGSSRRVTERLDVLFPVTHGRGGEDGTLQGMLELAGVPYVGCGVLASALCMDKAMAKRLLRDAGIAVVPWIEATAHEVQANPDAFLDRVEKAFGYPVFAKPSNTGSSVGIQKAHSREELRRALKDAARYDLRLVVEPALPVREVECSVLGGYQPEASVVGEIIPANEFYDYEAKYVSEDTELRIPAAISPEKADEIRAIAVRAFRALDCWGMARVDFFLDRRDDRVILNELNTLPGMTEGSLYWRAWEASGLGLPALVDRLIELALERFRERSALEIRYRS
jgi:D-alanine-D-alanine ligase